MKNHYPISRLYEAFRCKAYCSCLTPPINPGVTAAALYHLINPGLQQLCLLEFCAGVVWILFTEPTPASKGLQSRLCFAKNQVQGEKKKSFVSATGTVHCVHLNYPPLTTEEIWFLSSVKVNEFSTSLFFLPPLTAPHWSHYQENVTVTALTSPSIPPSSSTTPNGTGLLSLSQLMQFFILCNFLPLIWKNKYFTVI